MVLLPSWHLRYHDVRDHALLLARDPLSSWVNSNSDQETYLEAHEVVGLSSRGAAFEGSRFLETLRDVSGQTYVHGCRSVLTAR